MSNFDWYVKRFSIGNLWFLYKKTVTYVAFENHAEPLALLEALTSSFEFIQNMYVETEFTGL